MAVVVWIRANLRIIVVGLKVCCVVGVYACEETELQHDDRA